jgi:DNA-binding XRE family transcriptional regulator
VRILFAFDPWRSSILLVACDKAGQSERACPRGGTARNSFVDWNDIRAEHVERAGGEDAVEAGKRALLAEVIGHRLAEIRRARGMTQQQIADKMGVTEGRISQIERQDRRTRRPRPLRHRPRRTPPSGHLLRRRRHHRHRLTSLRDQRHGCG